jgi:hypothetical protein
MTSSSSSRGRRPKSTATSASSKTRKSSAYDKDFEQHYIDNRIYPEGYEYSDDRQTPEPGDLDELYQRLLQPRSSLSPSRFTPSDFRDFKRTNARVIDEGDVMRHVFPIIAGDSDILNKENLQFTRLDSMTGGVTVDPKPDFYDGARLEDIDKSVREELGPYIIPTRHRTAPVAPNFFVEVKGPNGAADVAKRQAMQNGACGARAMHSLQSYSEGRAVYDGKAYTITNIYHAGTGTLQVCTSHTTQVGDGISPQYHHTQVRGFALTGADDSFVEGATAFRNSRKWAQEKRDALIAAANERSRSTNAEPRREQMTYSDWLATLSPAQEPSVSNQDYEDPDCNPGETQDEYAEPFERRSSAPYEGAAPSTSGAKYLKSESSILDSSTYNGLSDAYLVEEFETSTDELALDSNVTPARRSKRQHRGSEAPRHRKSSRSHHSKRSEAPRHSHHSKRQ